MVTLATFLTLVLLLVIVAWIESPTSRSLARPITSNSSDVLPLRVRDLESTSILEGCANELSGVLIIP